MAEAGVLDEDADELAHEQGVGRDNQDIQVDNDTRTWHSGGNLEHEVGLRVLLQMQLPCWLEWSLHPSPLALMWVSPWASL